MWLVEICFLRWLCWSVSSPTISGIELRASSDLSISAPLEQNHDTETTTTWRSCPQQTRHDEEASASRSSCPTPTTSFANIGTRNLNDNAASKSSSTKLESRGPALRVTPNIPKSNRSLRRSLGKYAAEDRAIFAAFHDPLDSDAGREGTPGPPPRGIFVLAKPPSRRSKNKGSRGSKKKRSAKAALRKRNRERRKRKKRSSKRRASRGQQVFLMTKPNGPRRQLTFGKEPVSAVHPAPRKFRHRLGRKFAEDPLFVRSIELCGSNA